MMCRTSQEFVERVRGSGGSGSGNVRVFGQWFGPRAWDNWYFLERIEEVNDDIEVRFDGGEHVIVYRPEGFYLDDYVARIDRAERVVRRGEPDSVYMQVPGEPALEIWSKYPGLVLSETPPSN
jgi:hypothetical protein